MNKNCSSDDNCQPWNRIDLMHKNVHIYQRHFRVLYMTETASSTEYYHKGQKGDASQPHLF